MFNLDINGFCNEHYFVRAFNKKRIRNLNPIQESFIRDVFPNIRYEDIIYCYKDDNKMKYDIVLRLNNEEKYISIKKGLKNSVHCEKLDKFIDYLTSLGFSREILIKILKYQFADGTIYGIGKFENRLSTEEYKLLYKDDIKEINEKLNDIKYLRKFIDRFIITGTRNYSKPIDYIVYGLSNDFFWLSREEIYELFEQRLNEESNSVHISRLNYQPQDRCLNGNQLYEERRFVIQIKWYNIYDDILYYKYKNNKRIY